MNQLGAVLVGILILFIAPYVQRWRDKRAIAKGQKKSEAVKRQYSQVLVFALEPHSLTQHLIIQGILALGSAATMTVGMVWLVVVAIAGTGSAALPNNYFRVYWNGMGIFIWLMGAVPLFRLTAEAISLWGHIQSFDKYVESVPVEFRKPELERLAREKLRFPPVITVTPP
jgi:hypothetical protein